MRTVRAPDGGLWVVGRRLLPWAPRLRRAYRQAGEGTTDILGIGVYAESVAGLILLVLLLAATWFLLPLVLFVLEVAALLVVAPGVIVVRLALRRPWTIEAIPKENPAARHVWKRVGWRDSRRFVDAITRNLRAGERLPPADA